MTGRLEVNAVGAEGQIRRRQSLSENTIAIGQNSEPAGWKRLVTLSRDNAVGTVDVLQFRR
jgi:hypothetical protein